MLGSYTYLFWELLFIGIPLLILLRWWHQIRHRWRALLWTTVGCLVGGWLWDALAVRLNLWYYEADRIAGIWFGGLPVEEWLWIVGVTWMFGALTVVLIERDSR